MFVNSRPTPHDGPVIAAPRSSTGAAPTTAPPTSSPAHAAASAPASTGAATRGGAAAAPRSTAPAATAPLTVLNNSTEPGLGARAAAQFARGGWQIVKVGNFTGRIAVTTAYYAPGQEAAARALMARFPGIQRAHPRFAGLPGSGLTVVVTRGYPA